MYLFWLSVGVLLISSLLSFTFKRSENVALYLACGGCVVGSLLGLVFSIYNFSSSNAQTLLLTNLRGISVSFGIDSLSAFFLIVILGVSLLAAIYGVGYVKKQKEFLRSIPFYPLLVAAMMLVVVSRDGLSFLISWELMSLASYFLVVTEYENKEVQNAGWIYLIATHLATAFLMAFFVIAASGNSSLLFTDMVNVPRPVFVSGLLFIFALIGFGTKAGMFPFHIWLPYAHPAAPSYVSAVMSGVMIKTGIYGILRAITLIGEPQVWWGVVLIAAGVFSAVIGVLYALMQHDLKRLLAYHSVENIGIIITGIGIGVIGTATNNVTVELLGFGGAIFHVLNHAIFKGLLFLAAGSVMHAAHTLAIDRLGGLIKRLPVTAIVFLVAALAICGLPPFNGFISEWLVYIGLFKGAQSFSGVSIMAATAGVVGIAFAGGLAVACFTKVFGVVFLGEPRCEMPPDIKESSGWLLFPMISLSILCLLIGVFPGFIWPAVVEAAGSITGPSSLDAGWIVSSLNSVSYMFLLVIGLFLFFVAVYFIAFRKKVIEKTVTWDCGYASPAPRMQYTAASFAEPIAIFFKPLLKPFVHGAKVTGLFPDTISFSEHVSDIAESRFFTPLFGALGRAIMFVRRRRKSTIQSYLVLIFLVLMIFFAWEVWIGF